MCWAHLFEQFVFWCEWHFSNFTVTVPPKHASTHTSIHQHIARNATDPLGPRACTSACYCACMTQNYAFKIIRIQGHPTNQGHPAVRTRACSSSSMDPEHMLSNIVWRRRCFCFFVIWIVVSIDSEIYIDVETLDPSRIKGFELYRSMKPSTDCWIAFSSKLIRSFCLSPRMKP